MEPERLVARLLLQWYRSNWQGQDGLTSGSKLYDRIMLNMDSEFRIKKTSSLINELKDQENDTVSTLLREHLNQEGDYFVLDGVSLVHSLVNSIDREVDLGIDGLRRNYRKYSGDDQYREKIETTLKNNLRPFRLETFVDSYMQQYYPSTQRTMEPPLHALPPVSKTDYNIDEEFKKFVKVDGADEEDDLYWYTFEELRKARLKAAEEERRNDAREKEP